MVFKFYKASLPIKQTPQEEWQESYQQASDDFWENTSTVATIQAQTEVGVKEYADESVQITSVINPTTGENFGDRYRKLIHKSYNNADNYLGKMYSFDNHRWLTVNTNTRIGSVKTSILQQCNNILKWVNADGEVLEWECVYTRNLSGTTFSFGTQGVPQVRADAKIMVQRNNDTDNIPFNQRFLFDGHAFQVKQIDNHYADTLMSFYVFEVPLQVDDDLVNGIASNKGEITATTNEIRILPNITKIILGDTQEYTVYNYVNGEQTEDTFTISGENAPTTAYAITIIDGNTFSVTNKQTTGTPLTVKCTNNETDESVEINILLGGSW